jgi:ABC-2 type transport system permease protein
VSLAAAPAWAQTYDSARRSRPLIGTAESLWRYRGLLRLLVVRNITLRYKRSLLGVWWTLLNPLLTMLVMWVLFSQLFRFDSGNVPYMVYMFSGVILVGFFQNAVVTVGASVVDSSGVLTKVYVPAEIFCVAAATASMVNFLISLVPLLIIQTVIGPGIPWTVLLVPLVAITMLAFSMGVGLVVAALAARFYDALDLTAVAVQLLGWLTPTFYPERVVPAPYQSILHFNPLYHQLVVFRSLVYEGAAPPLLSVLVTVLSSVAALALGILVFSRSWKSIAVML